jgi:hypothetical protein
MTVSVPWSPSLTLYVLRLVICGDGFGTFTDACGEEAYGYGDQAGFTAICSKHRSI